MTIKVGKCTVHQPDGQLRIRVTGPDGGSIDSQAVQAVILYGILDRLEKLLAAVESNERSR